jgi:hypothetical protein
VGGPDNGKFLLELAAYFFALHVAPNREFLLRPPSTHSSLPLLVESPECVVLTVLQQGQSQMCDAQERPCFGLLRRYSLLLSSGEASKVDTILRRSWPQLLGMFVHEPRVGVG